jgi:DNA invertase Pin-like site-specific DNA recombinase
VGLSDAHTNKYEALLQYTESAKQGLVTPQKRAAKYCSDAPRRKYQHFDRLTDDRVDELVAAYVGGSSTYELVSQFGINRETVSRHLKSRAVQMRGTALGKNQLEEAERLHAAGHSLARIAEQIGVDATTVRRRLRARRAEKSLSAHGT